MHMADALVSPVVGGVMWVATLSVAAYSIRKIEFDSDEKKIPLMGVMGAFIFAAQMINFSILGTGSSGHLGGGLLLAVLLGPYAGFLTMASVLSIQALFFADGGLLALGCNIFNQGFFTCFIAYPLIYKRLVKPNSSPGRLLGATLLTAIVGLQMGAFGVVLETFFSGRTELPFGTFILLMLPIHLAIGVVEGLVTASVVSFVMKARPEILERAASGEALGNLSLRKVLVILITVTVLVGGVFSWFASSNPDGLEWSILRTSGQEELTATDNIHQTLAMFQKKIALLPDYSFKTNGSETAVESAPDRKDVNASTSVSGLVGGGLTLLLILLTCIAIRWAKKRKKRYELI